MFPYTRDSGRHHPLTRKPALYSIEIILILYVCRPCGFLPSHMDWQKVAGVSLLSPATPPKPSFLTDGFFLFKKTVDKVQHILLYNGYMWKKENGFTPLEILGLYKQASFIK